MRNSNGRMRSLGRSCRRTPNRRGYVHRSSPHGIALRQRQPGVLLYLELRHLHVAFWSSAGYDHVTGKGYELRLAGWQSLLAAQDSSDTGVLPQKLEVHPTRPLLNIRMAGLQVVLRRRIGQFHAVKPDVDVMAAVRSQKFQFAATGDTYVA